MERKKLAEEIYQVAYLRGDFLLRSGKRSNEYFDKYRFEANPVLLAAIADKMKPLLPKTTEVLAGLELGGVPLATALSLQTQLPCSFVRKAAKNYGTQRICEGADVNGKQLVVIEDVITTGGQVIESVTELRKAGAKVEHVLCVIDRSDDQGAKLKAHGLTFLPLFQMRELLP